MDNSYPMENKKSKSKGRNFTTYKPRNMYEGLPKGHIVYEKGFDSNGNKYCIPYEIGKLLGTGGFATCHVMKVVGHKMQFAGKAFYKYNPKNKDVGSIDKQIKMVSELDHPRIVKVYKKIQSRDYIIMLMERCTGGSLSNIMKTRLYLTEPEVRFLLNQIVEGLIYLKSKKIMHLDLKLSNILLDDTFQVKVADFGLAQSKMNIPHHKICGTLSYICPEMIKKQPLGYQADIWTTGILTYKLLLGRTPFEGSDIKSLSANVMGKYPQFKGKDKGCVISYSAQDLLRKMLEKDPSKRIKLEDIRLHSFLSAYPIPKSVDRRFSILAPSEAYLKEYDRLLDPEKDGPKLLPQLVTEHQKAYFQLQQSQQTSLRKKRKALARIQYDLQGSASSLQEPPILDRRGPIQYYEVRSYFRKIAQKLIVKTEKEKQKEKQKEVKKKKEKQNQKDKIIAQDNTKSIENKHEKQQKQMVPQKIEGLQENQQSSTITVEIKKTEPQEKILQRKKPPPRRAKKDLSIDQIRSKFHHFMSIRTWMNQSQMAHIFRCYGVNYVDLPVCRILYCEVLPITEYVLYLTNYGTLGLMFSIHTSILYNYKYNSTSYVNLTADNDYLILNITEKCPEQIAPKHNIMKKYMSYLSEVPAINELLEKAVIRDVPYHMAMSFMTKYDFRHEMLIFDTIIGDVTFLKENKDESIVFSKSKGKILSFDAQFNSIECSINDEFEKIFPQNILKKINVCSRWLRGFLRYQIEDKEQIMKQDPRLANLGFENNQEINQKSGIKFGDKKIKKRSKSIRKKTVGEAIRNQVAK